ncbi:hypothetical protein [Yersinia massiliensis]|uniref:hypothetical protein n=1 Tax=Yersinia massiliensis TaxID=419257 RepID=UPI003703BFE5
MPKTLETQQWKDKPLSTKEIDPQEQKQLRSTLEVKTYTFKLAAERWWRVKKTSVAEGYAEDIF